MSLELVVLLAFVGLITIRVMAGGDGPIGAFNRAGPSLGARVEVQMTTGRCFAVPHGGKACANTITWQ